MLVTQTSDAPSDRRVGPVPPFAEVAEECLDSVYRFLGHMVGDRHLADDLTADTFERALRAWPSYDPERGTPVMWLVGIARRIALDHFRSEKRRRERETRWASTEPLVAEPPSGPSGLSPQLRVALAGLAPAERELVALRVVLGFSTSEAAAIVGSTPSGVSTQLHRTMNRLRKEVASHAAA
jgi:RNA polymerase sigma factor (sigma-70 family)